MPEYITREQVEQMIILAKAARDEVCNVRHTQTDKSIDVLFKKFDELVKKLDTISMRLVYLIIATLLTLIANLVVKV